MNSRAIRMPSIRATSMRHPLIFGNPDRQPDLPVCQ
jgi:hypothetical protein